MYKVYNKRAITRQERFKNALIYGIGATVLITAAYGLLSSFLFVELQIVYLSCGYAIGYLIQKYGRGVQVQFSILAAVLAIFCFVIGDLISWFGFEALLNPGLWPMAFQFIFSSYLSTSISSLLSLAFRVGGVYLAYVNARVV